MLVCGGCNKWTIQDIWRMVWQEQCGRIVMVTNLVEKGKVSECQCFSFRTLFVGELMSFVWNSALLVVTTKQSLFYDIIIVIINILILHSAICRASQA